MRRSRYLVQLTPAMIIALVDIALSYRGEESKRWDGRTLRALERRELVMMGGRRLTKKGAAYLSACDYEYRTAQEWIDAVLDAIESEAA